MLLVCLCMPLLMHMLKNSVFGVCILALSSNKVSKLDLFTLETTEAISSLRLYFFNHLATAIFKSQYNTETITLV